MNLTVHPSDFNSSIVLVCPPFTVNSRYCTPLCDISEVTASTLLIAVEYVKEWLVEFPKLLFTVIVFVPPLNDFENTTVASVPAVFEV